MKEVLSILNSYSIHPLIQTCKRPDILLELAYVCKNQEFLLLKALLCKL